MDRYVCIHGHFYQPPRENPWLEAIELQESAYPYHDWNEHITAECYAPNALSRMLDGEGRIVRIVNNYSRISFNFGPTLLSWLADKDPETYAAVLDADRLSRERFSGHGSAIAQVYNHVIMPLADRRDKRTQVRWGLADFEHRFGRKAEGMWLAETAADTETLEVLSEHGIRFTVLSPYQAAKAKFLGEREWQDVDGGRIDPTRPYECRLPSGRSIAVFFYDGPISRGIAFEGLLRKGEDLAGRLLGAFNDARTWPQLVHIATDGETYGHHHKYGDMALAYALAFIEQSGVAKLTNYAEYLAKCPPTHEVRIHEASAWSCPHGVGRWKEDCGCGSGGRPGWHQKWRGPLRAAFDWLRDQTAPGYEGRAKEYWPDPWAVRDDYVRVVLDRSPKNRAAFFRRHGKDLTGPDLITATKLLEMQRHALLMYTSCGWFFDEISGIETVQCIEYADRVVQLAGEVLGLNLEGEFAARLQEAPSNLPEVGHGRRVYEKHVKPCRVNLPKVAAHFAVSSLFEQYPEALRIYSYSAEVHDLHTSEAGKAKLNVGRARITSEVTQESAEVAFGAVHFGDHNLSGGARRYFGEEVYQKVREELERSFESADFPSLIVALDKHLDAASHSLRSLFRDEQRKILGVVLESTEGSMEAVARQVYEQHLLLMRFLLGLDAPLPKPFVRAAEHILNTDLRRAIEADEPDLDRIAQLREEADTWRVTLDAAGLGFALTGAVDRQIDRVRQAPGDSERVLRCGTLVELARSFPFDVDLWRAQNAFYRMLQTDYARQSAAEWLAAFRELGDRLGVRV